MELRGLGLPLRGRPFTPPNGPLDVGRPSSLGALLGQGGKDALGKGVEWLLPEKQTRPRIGLPRDQSSDTVVLLCSNPCEHLEGSIPLYPSAVLSRSVMSDSLPPTRLQPTSLLCPWGFSRQE